MRRDNRWTVSLITADRRGSQRVKQARVIPYAHLTRAFPRVFRVLAARCGVVQRIRDMRRARVFREHNAHVLHLPGPLPGDPQSAQNTTHIHETSGGLQDCRGLAAGHAGLQLHHGVR